MAEEFRFLEAFNRRKSGLQRVNLTRLNRQAAIDGASISAQASPVPAALGSMEYLTPDTASTQSVVTRLVSHPLM